jgi:plasmid stability protein
MHSSGNSEISMASMTIRDLDDDVKRRLRVRAAHNNRSMEEEARAILKAAVTSDPKPKSLVRAIRARIEPLGGVDLTIDARESIRDIKLD